MNDETLLKIERLNDALEELFKLAELKRQKAKECLFEEVKMFRDREMKLLRKITLQLEALRQSDIKIKLFLDNKLLRRRDFLRIKNYHQFVYFIKYLGLPDFISFDQNLEEAFSGYDCAKWLVIHCLEQNLILPGYVVHNQYPIGKGNIECLLFNFEKRTKLS